MDFGALYFTAGVARAAEKDAAFFLEVMGCLFRYQRRDWGELCAEDLELNSRALRSGARIMGSYTTELGGKIWIITEAEDDNGRRAATTVLFPDEY